MAQVSCEKTCVGLTCIVPGLEIKETTERCSTATPFGCLLWIRKYKSHKQDDGLDY